MRKANAGPVEKPGAENKVDDTIITDADDQRQDQSAGDVATSTTTVDTSLFDVENLWEKPPTPESFRKVLPPPIVGKPEKNVFFRVNPDQAYTVDVKILETTGPERKTKTWYWVAPHLRSEPVLADELVVVRLSTIMTKTGVVYLWPLKLFDEDHSSYKWTATGLTVLEEAKTSWVKVIGDINYGGYVATVAARDHGEPRWPAEPFVELVGKGFQRRTITSLDHEVVQAITGEI